MRSIKSTGKAGGLLLRVFIPKRSSAMRKRWTRREFLETGLKGSMMMGGAVTMGTAQPQRHTRIPRRQTSPAGLETRQQVLLRAAIDEIIPAGDGMPSASEAGGVEYLNRLVSQLPEARKDLD